MNNSNIINRIKEKSIAFFLSEKGFKPCSRSGNKEYYPSPIRPGDNNPSFVLYLESNTWADFGYITPDGTKAGGSIIDLVKYMENVDTASAIRLLKSKTIPNADFKESVSTNKTPITIIKVVPIQSKALLNYIAQRKIHLTTANKYLKEVKYTNNGKKYYSLGMQNDMGGWELRSNNFQGGTSPKHITTIPGNLDNANIFEGFFDYLAFLDYYKTKRPKNTTIILNSITLASKTIDFVKEFDSVNLFLDNDKGGVQTAKFYREHLSKVHDQAKNIYPGYKDFNDFILGNKLKDK